MIRVALLTRLCQPIWLRRHKSTTKDGIPVPKWICKEERMLQHVFRDAQPGNAQSVLDSIDAFCWQQSKNWMMNIGNDKGALLDALLLKHRPNRIVELGTYCGYSATRMARLLQPPQHLYSIERSRLSVRHSQSIVDLAGVADRVTILYGTTGDVLPKLRELHGAQWVDFLFIDHAHKQYLRDMQLVERLDLLHVGSVVVADNVLQPGVPDYVQYMERSAQYRCGRLLCKWEYQTEVDDALLVAVKQ